MTSITPREASLESTHLGFQRHTQGQYVEALQTFDAALELDDTMCLAWICKGRALLELNRLPEAQAAFERALSLDPSNSTALQGYATAQGISRDEQGWGLPLDLDGEGLASLVEFLISLAIHH